MQYSVLTKHLEDGFARLCDVCRSHTGDSSGADGRGTWRCCLAERLLLLLLLLAVAVAVVAAGGDRGAAKGDADTDVQNRNENHRKNEQQEC